MTQLDLSPLDQMLMDLLAMVPRLRLPPGDGAFIQTEGGHDGLQRAAVTEQRDHQDHQITRSMEPIEGSACGGGEGPTAAGAPIAVLPAAVDPDGPLPSLASGRAGGVVAELALRVHGCPPVDAMW
jgi:hypothetical protein